MRRLAIAIGLAALTLASPAGAQIWPTRPVTMVVPFAAGGAVDVIGRILAPPLSDKLGQQVIIENVGGAGGMTGSSRVAKASPDGYQFVLGSIGTHAHSQVLNKRPLYDATTDFAPIILISEQPLVLIARKDFPAATLPEFIAYAKANQAKMQYGSAGTGSAVHLGCVLLNAAIGINVTHIPYRGGAPAMQDLLGGRIDYQCTITSTGLSQIDSGAVKAIALLSRVRSLVLPNLPTAHEQGLDGFDAYTWNALFLPKGTPDVIVRKLNEAVAAALDLPEVQRRLHAVGATVTAPDRRSPDYLARFVKSEIEKWAGPIKASGVGVN